MSKYANVQMCKKYSKGAAVSLIQYLEDMAIMDFM